MLTQGPAVPPGAPLTLSRIASHRKCIPSHTFVRPTGPSRRTTHQLREDGVWSERHLICIDAARGADPDKTFATKVGPWPALWLSYRWHRARDPGPTTEACLREVWYPRAMTLIILLVVATVLMTQVRMAQRWALVAVITLAMGAALLVL